MATLELAKAHHVLLRQDELFAPVVITIGDKFYEDAPELGEDGPKNSESEPSLSLE
jgi:chromatin segregation and condensation protein Rec8/ScpA/Scc1 (kleisin family)